MLVVLLLGLLAGCAPPSLVAEALRARGGRLPSLVRDVELDVYRGFPGRWRLRTAFLVPDRYAWTVLTMGEPDHYLFDGAVVRVFVGDRPVGSEAGAGAPLRTLARFTAVVGLDALLLPGVRVAPLAPEVVPAGVATALEAMFADDGSRYEIGFDTRRLVVWAAGPVTLPPIGRGRLEARYAEPRRVGGRLLAHRAEYVFAGQPLAVERTLAACPEAPGLVAASFRHPAGLPPCPRVASPTGVR